MISNKENTETKRTPTKFKLHSISKEPKRSWGRKKVTTKNWQILRRKWDGKNIKMQEGKTRYLRQTFLHFGFEIERSRKDEKTSAKKPGFRVYVSVEYNGHQFFWKCEGGAARGWIRRVFFHRLFCNNYYNVTTHTGFYSHLLHPFRTSQNTN